MTGPKRTIVAVAIVLAGIIGIFCYTGSALAQDSDKITLGVSPQLLDLTANPGDTLTNTFRLTNGSDKAVDVEAVPKNFSPNGEEGAVNLTQESTAFSLAQWIQSSPEKTTIPARKTQDFKITISVPKNAEPGSHFGSVVFRTIPPDEKQDTALVSQEIAPVILVKIAGDTKETAEIASFAANQSSYTNQDTISFTSRIKNTGNVHFQPTGKIIIKNMFGKKVAEIELDKKNVLPDSIRAITSDWRSDHFRLGRYSAELTIVYGKDSSIATAQTSFTIIPWQTILPWLAGIIIIGYVIFRFRKRIILALRVLSGKTPQE